MAINGCGINAHVINAAACRRRALFQPPQPEFRGGSAAPAAYAGLWGAEVDDDPLESGTIGVSITINGKSYLTLADNLPDMTASTAIVTKLLALPIIPMVTIRAIKSRKR